MTETSQAERRADHAAATSSYFTQSLPVSSQEERLKNHKRLFLIERSANIVMVVVIANKCITFNWLAMLQQSLSLAFASRIPLN
jgi:hypothetical protein